MSYVGKFGAITALLGATFLSAPAFAGDINEVIDATNFVVANQCSGTLISLKYRLVLTNDHCLSGYVDQVDKTETAPDGEVKTVKREVYKDLELKQIVYKEFEPVSSTTFQAKVLFHSAKFDLALLKIKADSIPQTIYSHVLPDSKKVTRGDHVYVVGNPHMLDANLNEGVVSSTARTIHWDETNEDVHYYGIDAGVNPGNSGGSLYNADLDLIGVPGATMRNSTGLGFAIPAETIRTFLTEHCYEDVWNDKAADHAACLQGKLDKENAARAKAGLPAKEAPKEQDSMTGDSVVVHATSLDIKAEKPLPAPVVAPAPKKDETTVSKRLLDLLGSIIGG